MRDDLLLYYERELDYLRKMAVQFAEKHPKVASRLVLEPTKCEDPHVERLLEAFAFLAARVHLKRDAPLYSRPVGGVPCVFRTCYDTMLWPVSVTAAEWKSPSRLVPPVKAGDSSGAIRVELRCAPDVNLKALKMDRLRLHLHGES